MKKMNLWTTSFTLFLNMVGTGIFLLPVNIASMGSISSLGWLATTFGAGSVGLMFAILASIKSTRNVIKNQPEYQINYVYWTASVVGNIAIATAATSYLTRLVPALQNFQVDLEFTIFIIWLAVLLNLVGSKWLGFFTHSGTYFALVPIGLMMLIGWFWFDPKLYHANWNPHDLSSWNGIPTATFLPCGLLWEFKKLALTQKKLKTLNAPFPSPP